MHHPRTAADAHAGDLNEFHWEFSLALDSEHDAVERMVLVVGGVDLHLDEVIGGFVSTREKRIGAEG